jgi:predicted transposase/invertase (TIGR01784 family)
MIKDLLEGFVSEEFIKHIDFTSIDTVKNTFIAPKYKKRETDLIIKLKIKEQEVYIYSLIEFQSKPDRFIGLRVLTYILLFYQSLIKEKKIKGRGAKLPPVFPLVLYTGKVRWNMKTELKELILQPYEDLKKYVPQFTYYKIALNQLPEDGLQELYTVENIVAAFFNMIIAKDEKTILKSEKILSNLVKDNDELWNMILEWLNHFFMSKDIDISKITLRGGEEMLDTVIDNIRMEGKLQGKLEGKLEGEIEGEIKKSRKIAKNLLKMNMPIEQIALVTELSFEEIQKMADGNYQKI